MHLSQVKHTFLNVCAYQAVQNSFGHIYDET